MFCTVDEGNRSSGPSLLSGLGEAMGCLLYTSVKSELDWQLYLLQRRYLDYQVNIGNTMIELLSGDEEQRSLAPSLSPVSYTHLY